MYLQSWVSHHDIKLTVIEKFITGLDGISRAAEIRTTGGRTSHPITKLFHWRSTKMIPQWKFNKSHHQM